MIPFIIILSVIVFIMFSNGPKSKSDIEEATLVSSYSRLPPFRTTGTDSVHVILPFDRNTRSLIRRVLCQTVKADMMTVIVPDKYETYVKTAEDELCRLIQRTCLIQISGGLSLLAKERNRNTVLVFLKSRQTALVNPRTLEQILLIADSSRKPIVYLTETTVLRSNIDIDFRAIYNLKLI